MRHITELTSKICGCTTWLDWETTDPQETRVVTDFAIAPCEIHDPINHGKILLDKDYANREYLINLRDTQLTLTAESVLMSFIPDKQIEKIEVIRPEEIRNDKDNSRVVPLIQSVAFRKEIMLQAETEGVFLNMPEISEDEIGIDETGEEKVVGRKFKEGIEVKYEFDNDRKMKVEFKGTKVGDIQKAETALDNSPIDRNKIIISNG